MFKKKLLRTAGYASITLGLYLLYKGSDETTYKPTSTSRDDIIEAEWFEVKEGE